MNRLSLLGFPKNKLSLPSRAHQIPKQKAWQDCNKQGKPHKNHKIGYSRRSVGRQRPNDDKPKPFKGNKTKQQQQHKPRQTKQKLKCLQRSQREQTLNTSQADWTQNAFRVLKASKPANRNKTKCLDQNATKSNKGNIPLNKYSENKPKPERYLPDRTMK